MILYFYNYNRIILLFNVKWIYYVMLLPNYISHGAITNFNSVLGKWLSVRLRTKGLWVRVQ